jgi:hypothetical protein
MLATTAHWLGVFFFCEIKYAFDELGGSSLSASTHLHDWVKRWGAALMKNQTPSMMVMGSHALLLSLP